MITFQGVNRRFDKIIQRAISSGDGTRLVRDAYKLQEDLAKIAVRSSSNQELIESLRAFKSRNEKHPAFCDFDPEIEGDLSWRHEYSHNQTVRAFRLPGGEVRTAFWEGTEKQAPNFKTYLHVDVEALQQMAGSNSEVFGMMGGILNAPFCENLHYPEELLAGMSLCKKARELEGNV